MKLFRNIALMLLMAMAADAVAVADIIENFNRSGSTVTLIQPEALAGRIAPADPSADNPSENEEEAQEEADGEKEAVPAVRSKGRIVGYRVQIYADNNVRVAKGEARQRERAVGRRFPAYMTYVAYASPYWRLRVGDFRTQAEAEKAATEIRHAFPGYAREVRVVRDRINAR